MTKWLSLACILILGLQYPVYADTPPPGTVKIKGGTDGTTIGNVGDAQKVNLTNNPTISGTVSVSNFPATQPISAVSLPLASGAATSTLQSSIITALGSPFQAGASIGNSSFGISGTLPAFAVTPTFNLGTLNGAALNSELITINTTLGSPFQSGGSIGNTSFGISGTLPAYGSTPTFNLGTLNGAATSANQATEISSLASIVTNTTGIATSANQTTANSSLSTIATNTTGVATAANQGTANTSLASIDSKLTSPVTVTPNSASPGRSSVTLARNVYSSVNVTTSAYVQLVASLSNSVNEVEIFDSSGQTLVIAVGGIGSEVDQAYIVPGGNGRIPLAITTSSRVSIKAISATANSGEIDVNFYH